MKEYSGLDQLRSTGANGLYCPKCGNYLEVVMNGWFHGQLLFCPKEEKVFCVQIKDITANAGKEYIQSCKDDIEVKELRRKITSKNLEKARDAVSVL